MTEFEDFVESAPSEEPTISTISATSSRYLTSNSDLSLLRCFKELELSSSSLFQNPLYFLPEPENPGIFEALRYEPPLEIDNDIGRERYVRICNTLEIPPLKRILQYLDQDELDLSYYGLRAKELQALFYVLEMNAYIKTLVLEENFMEPESVHLLSQMLSQNFTITTLSLKKCNIGPEGAKALVEGIQLSVTLKELDLSFNFIGDEGLRASRSAFKSNESITKINFENNGLSSNSAKYLQEIFAENAVLTHVDLAWNNISEDDAMKKLVAGLKITNNLVSLNLSWNGLESDVVAKQLARYIREADKLEFIDLSNNMFKGSSLGTLSKAIGANGTLRHVKLGNNPITPTEASTLGSLMLRKVSKLEILNLENVFFPRSFNQNLQKIKTSGKTLVIGGVLGNFKIKGPNQQEVLLKRCHYLGLAPKRAKAKRDFGQIVLTLPPNPMTKTDFEQFVRKKKKGKMYDLDLLTELRKAFETANAKIDTQSILAEYMKLYPETALPPPKRKKTKAKKEKKQKKTPSKTQVPPTVETENEDASEIRKVSFSDIPRSPSAADPTSLKPKTSVVSQPEPQEDVPPVESYGDKRDSSLKVQSKEAPEEAKTGVTISEEVEIITM